METVRIRRKSACLADLHKQECLSKTHLQDIHPCDRHGRRQSYCEETMKRKMNEMNQLEQNIIMKNILREIEVITEIENEKKKSVALRNNWHTLGHMFDCLYFWFFVLMLIFTLVYILTAAYVGKMATDADEDFHDIIHSNYSCVGRQF